NLATSQPHSPATNLGRMSADLNRGIRRRPLPQLQQIPAHENGLLPRLRRARFIDHCLTVDVEVFQFEGPAAHDGSHLNLAATHAELLVVRWPNDIANRALRRIIGSK